MSFSVVSAVSFTESLSLVRGELVPHITKAPAQLCVLEFSGIHAGGEGGEGEPECTADGCRKPLYYFQLVDACVSCMPVLYLQEEVSRLILFSHHKPEC